MTKKIAAIFLALLIGFGSGYFFFSRTKLSRLPIPVPFISERREILGFLPYWLISAANKDYSPLTELIYFNLTISENGKIQKLVSETEEEPGWTTLRTGKADKALEEAKKNGTRLSLAVFNADEETVARLMDDPILHADNLMSDITPIMKNRGFGDLNLDIESFQIASSESRRKFVQFTKQIKKHIDEDKLGTLTIDVSPSALIRNYLIDPIAVSQYADRIVFMSYDYHYLGSSTTGPVSPIGGAGENEEIDSTVFMKKAISKIPKEKIILGTALYGYEWETLSDQPRSGIIPGTGLTASSRRVESFLSKCSSCSAEIDELSRESYVIYKDQDTGAYRQIFYPDKRIIEEKIKLSEQLELGGLAFWALGYESDDILSAFDSY